ncbi:hypothetical protein D0726_003381 [Escherichia coli]|nr:hypothetical protein [Escherichia coli]
MDNNTAVLNWYEKEVMTDATGKYLKCPECNEVIYKPHFTKHVATHGLTLEALVIKHVLPDGFSTCPYPGCTEKLRLRHPTKLGSGVTLACCNKHASSVTMAKMRNDPTLVAKHAAAQSKRMTDNNPAHLAHVRAIHSESLTRRWQDGTFRNTVASAAKNNMEKQLQDPEFLKKKSEAASKRMTELNKDPEFRKELYKRHQQWVVDNPQEVHKNSMFSAYVQSKEETLVIYYVVFKDYFKLGVTTDAALRLTHLYGYRKHYFIEDVPKAVALSIEYWVKEHFEQYTGEHEEVKERTEVFQLKDFDAIVKVVDDRIAEGYIDPVLSDWVTNKKE